MKKLFALILLTCLTGCLAGRSTPSQIYTLTPIQSEQTIPSVKSTISVNSVHLPSYLNRPQMVVYQGTNTDLTISEKNRWADPLADLMPRILATDLAIRLPNAVIKQRTLANEKFNYQIALDITQLDTRLGDKITMRGWWSITRPNASVLLQEKIFITLPVSDNFSDMAIQQSKLMGELATQIARKIETLK